MSDWIRIKTPDGDIWSDQEHFLRQSDIRSLRLVKKVAKVGGPENGVSILIAPQTSYGGSWSSTYWIRCKDFEAARTLYEDLILKLDPPDA